MKKFFLSIYLILILLMSTGISFSWDSTAAKYYPLQIGNKWCYQRVLYGNNRCLQMPNPTEYTISIVRDTLINNKKYYVFSDGSRERIDSLTMNVYRYNGAFDQMLDSLLARKNDHYYGIRLDFFNSYCTVSDTFQSSFEGHTGNCKHITVSGNGFNEYNLLNGIGVTSVYKCFQNGYRDYLIGCVINGVQLGTITGTSAPEEIPSEIFELQQNFPNPFNPVTHFRFRIPDLPLVRLSVYDVLGKEVQVLVNEELKPGSYVADWDASAYPSGVYYYKLEVSPSTSSGRSFSETKKMVLIK